VQDMARPGVAWPGKGHRRWHGGLRPSLPPSQGWTWFGAARRGAVRRGKARRGLVRHGLQTAARSLFGGSLLLSSEGSSGGAQSGKDGYGGARLGEAWLTLTISAQGASAPSAGFSGIQTRRDTLRQSWASFGSAWHDTARTDELSTEGASLPYWAHSTHFMA